MASDIAVAAFYRVLQCGALHKAHDPMYEELYKDCAYSKQLEKGPEHIQNLMKTMKRALEYAEK